MKRPRKFIKKGFNDFCPPISTNLHELGVRFRGSRKVRGFRELRKFFVDDDNYLLHTLRQLGSVRF
jgi:hypothetical protein